MIDFACKSFNVNEVIMCSLGLSRADFRLLDFLLMEEKPLTASQISKKLNLDRTTVQKSIKRLVEKGVVARHQTNLKRGGYIFNYMLIEKEILKKRILGILNAWSEKAGDEIRRW